MIWMYRNSRVILPGVCLLLNLSVATAADNMRFHGALVMEPCVVNPGDDEITVDFGSVIEKSLYLNQRTPGQTFQLRLANCDIQLGNSVKVSFSGTPDSALPGFLALDSSSQASGIAIGIETPQGQLLALEQSSASYTLSQGSNVINLRAFIQAEPTAIAGQSIGRGAFSAVATFNLTYE